MVRGVYPYLPLSTNAPRTIFGGFIKSLTLVVGGKTPLQMVTPSSGREQNQMDQFLSRTSDGHFWTRKADPQTLLYTHIHPDIPHRSAVSDFKINF